ncbi:hypothetical protein O181_075986 [Austropuccinia psidii MF-1]|uniref:Reverse transcriptase RNase H-like domain-containing protein n=1 Tax=Austropuccinia psidii MF-1 TaxID=1389203 RepID=A0A9Q3FFG8_9BASI|nr:hypothetical protein [Austropuccinia psidii MF-1]
MYVDLWGEGLTAALHQVKLVNYKPYEGTFCFISIQRETTEARYGGSQMECLFLVWALEKPHYYFDGSVFEVITDFNAFKSILNIKMPNRHMLIWQISLQEYRGKMTIEHEAGNINTNANGLSKWELTNTPDNTAYVLANAEPQITIEGINITYMGTDFFEEVRDSYKQDKNHHTCTSLLDKDFKDTALANSSNEISKKSYHNGKFPTFDGILYHRSIYTGVMVLCSRVLINTILLE